MKLKRIKALTIRRSKWARGGKNGPSALLNDNGNMCCLGFWCTAAGLAQNALHVGRPDVIGVRTIPLLVRGGSCTALANEAIAINDNGSLVDAERESMLRKLFATKGVKLRFVP